MHECTPPQQPQAAVSLTTSSWNGLPVVLSLVLSIRPRNEPGLTPLPWARLSSTLASSPPPPDAFTPAAAAPWPGSTS
jgi:hypothetical protein